MTQNNPDTIPVNCDIPSELLAIMEDYKAIGNHLITYGIHYKIGLEKHYYPLAEDDDSGKPKPIPPFRELRDNNRKWYQKYYSKYPAHYLGSAASFAMQLIASWRTNGGDITAIPHMRKPIARLDRELFKILESKSDGTMRIRISISPHKYTEITIKVNHRHWNEWAQNRIGALVIVPDGVRLCFTDRIMKSYLSLAADILDLRICTEPQRIFSGRITV